MADPLHVYIDESIHTRGGFTLGACVFGNDADSAVAAALNECGLHADEEFKSSTRMDSDSRYTHLRDELKHVAREYRVGLVIAPSEPRYLFGTAAIDALSKFITANSLSSRRLRVFFDQGILARQPNSLPDALALAEVACDCDSRLIRGLQIADLVAHTAATMLLAELGLVNKVVKVGEESGYGPDAEMTLEFELWASLRYQFFHADVIVPNDPDADIDLTANVADHGLFIAPECSDVLRNASLERFGTCWLGCIH
jgi:hypothetical protein